MDMFLCRTVPAVRCGAVLCCALLPPHHDAVEVTVTDGVRHARAALFSDIRAGVVGFDRVRHFRNQ